MKDLIALLAGLASLIAVAVFGARWDSSKKRKRSAALAALKVARAEEKARANADELHAEIHVAAEIAKADPAPTESDVEVQREKIKKLWSKLLKHRGRR